MKSFVSKSPVKQIDISKKGGFKTPQKSPRNINDKVQVIIRIRPFLKDEDQQQLITLQNENTLKIIKPGNNIHMKFNNIVSGNTGQKQVFNIVSDSINSFLKGVNNTIFAYGQTGAGKTYTITGDYPENISTLQNEAVHRYLTNQQSRGILPRSLQMIFYEIKRRKQPNAKVLLSFYEIYNERIYDLYNPNSVALQIRQCKNGQVSIPDLLNIQVENLNQAMDFLCQGLKNRVTKSTYANSKSSRSHSIFQIVYERLGKVKNGDKITEFLVTSSIRIVDLAGSEKFKVPSDLSQAEQQIRIQQLTCINGSLSSLGHCISALIQKSRTHIPFRDSKLTRILSDSLIGNGKLRLIICISPSVSSSNETFSTLQFANRAKKAIVERNPPKVSIEKKKTIDYEQYLQLLEQYEKQKNKRIELQQILEESDKKQLIEENIRLQKENSQLKEQIKILTNSNKINQGNKEHSNHNISNITNNHKSSPNRNLVQKSSNNNNIINSKIKKHYQPPLPSKLVNSQEFENKSFLSLSLLKDERQRQTEHRKKQAKMKEANTKIQMGNKKRKMFQNKIQKFLDHDSPEKSFNLDKWGDKSLSNRKKPEYNQTKTNLLDEIRKAIKSKEDWFDIGNNSQSSEINDENTRLQFYGNALQNDDQQLFKSQQEDSNSMSLVQKTDQPSRMSAMKNLQSEILKTKKELNKFQHRTSEVDKKRQY